VNIGDLIRVERKAKGKTLAEIADALTISPNTIWELEKQNRGSMATLERVCQCLGSNGSAYHPVVHLEIAFTPKGLGGLDARNAGQQGRRLATTVIRVEADRGYISTLCSVLNVIAPDFRARKPLSGNP